MLTIVRAFITVINQLIMSTWHDQTLIAKTHGLIKHVTGENSRMIANLLARLMTSYEHYDCCHGKFCLGIQMIKGYIIKGTLLSLASISTTGIKALKSSLPILSKLQRC